MGLYRFRQTWLWSLNFLCCVFVGCVISFHPGLLKTDLMEELGETILVHEGGKPQKVSKQKAVVKSLVSRTLRGDARAASLLLSMMMRLLDTGEGAPEEVEGLQPDELEILEAYKKQLMADEKEPAAEGTDMPEETS